MGNCASAPGAATDSGKPEKLAIEAMKSGLDLAVAPDIDVIGGLFGGLLLKYAAHVYREARGIPHPPTDDELQAMQIDRLIAANDTKRLRGIASAGSWLFHLRHPHTGGAAVHAAAQHDRPACVPLLLRAGARVDSPTRINKHTPLMVAAMHGSAAALCALLAAHAGVGYVDACGRTALHHAAAAGSAACVEALLQAGADPAAMDDDGKTAADLAKESGHENCAALLPPAINQMATATRAG